MLYIGQHRHGLYALPSLVDSSTAATSNTGQLLLEGPLSVPRLSEDSDKNDPLSYERIPVYSTDTSTQMEYQTAISLGTDK